MNENQYHFKARKRFGQNFLRDQVVIDNIILFFNAQLTQHIVEIGPGQGALTLPLLHLCKYLDAVEIDRDLILLLQDNMESFDNINIHEADALRFNYQKLVKGQERFRVIGNLPYNIATPLLLHLLAQSKYIDDMLFMLQREVVGRICAQPGSKNYGRLSIMLQYKYQVECLLVIPPKAFEPMPKVESAVVYLHPLTNPIGGSVSLEALSFVVRKSFSQRRKTIANTLKHMISMDVLESIGLEPGQRPETVSVEQFVVLTRTWLETIDY